MGKNIENLDKSAKFNIAKCPKFNLASAAKLTYNLASKFFKSHAKCYKKIASSPSTCKHHRSSKYYVLRDILVEKAFERNMVRIFFYFFS